MLYNNRKAKDDRFSNSSSRMRYLFDVNFQHDSSCARVYKKKKNILPFKYSFHLIFSTISAYKVLNKYSRYIQGFPIVDSLWISLRV